MLKITEQCGAEVDSLTLVLEGRLAGPWVEELSASCRQMSARQQRCAMIDLTGVTYIDANGKALLACLWRRGVELEASGCLTRCVVEEIRRSEREGPSKKT
ncbi:MAG: hypothetical protein CV081_10865 [Nitrospira sp. LK265]|nr:hypothetical protein [Nitrospira sp. LK265]